MTTRIDLPDKLFFKIGEVSDIADVKPHVLRYWESEFSSIRPQKSRSGQRLYRRQDVEAVLAIRHLLYDRRFTIEGARQHLKENGVAEALPAPDPEAIAAAVRRDAERRAEEEVVRARAGTRRFYETQLLAIRTEVLRFLDELQAPAAIATAERTQEPPSAAQAAGPAAAVRTAVPAKRGRDASRSESKGD